MGFISLIFLIRNSIVSRFPRLVIQVLRNVGKVFAPIHKTVGNQLQSLVSIIQRLIIFVSGIDIYTFRLPFLGPIGDVVIANFVDLSLEIFNFRVHPFVVYLPAPFLLQNLIAF